MWVCLKIKSPEWLPSRKKQWLLRRAASGQELQISYFPTRYELGPQGIRVVSFHGINFGVMVHRRYEWKSS